MVPEYEKIRLKYSKLGSAKFISHLDIDRMMKSVLARAGIEAEHTHGYNPRPYLVFSLPLPLGVESVCEYLDIRVPSGTSGEVADKMNTNLPPSIQITESYTPESDFSSVFSSRYVIKLTSLGLSDETAKKIKELFTQPVIIDKRTKKTKSGVMPFDITPFVYELDALYDGDITINAVLSAENNNYINPEYIMAALRRYLNLTLDDPRTQQYIIMRTAVYTRDGAIFK